jgi:hypothetical protein
MVLSLLLLYRLIPSGGFAVGAEGIKTEELFIWFKKL